MTYGDEGWVTLRRWGLNVETEARRSDPATQLTTLVLVQWAVTCLCRILIKVDVMVVYYNEMVENVVVPLGFSRRIDVEWTMGYV
jgi:hypothetical protein